MYQYSAVIVRVVDADTVDADVDLGFKIRVTLRFRLARVDAPELSTPEGKDAKAQVEAMLKPGTHVMLATSKGDRYGRWIAEVFLPSGLNVSDWLMASGFAKAYT